jgi:DHA1 family bicyclomycin/chloramphenicol resistance-like MFS transporter
MNVRLVVGRGSGAMMRYGTLVAAPSGVVLALDARTGFGGLWGLAVPLFAFVGSAGFIVANSVAGALASYPDRAGAVSALVGAIHYGSGIFGSALVGIFADGTPWPIGWVIAGTGVGSAVCAWLLVSPGAARAETDDPHGAASNVRRGARCRQTRSIVLMARRSSIAR